MRIGFRTSFVALMLLGAASAAGVWAEEYDFTVVDKDEIYYGKGKHPKEPAVTKADDVWDEIPEYKQIVDEELTEDDPRYLMLMRKATERFNKALKKLAERDDHDMIGETGSIKANDKKKTIPDVTKELIKLVERD